MESREEKLVSARAFYGRFLLKTGIRSVIWFAAAYLIVDRWPHLSWLWYIVAVFIVIGMVVSLLALVGAKIESKSGSEENT